MPRELDLIVQSSGNLITLNPLASSPIACHLVMTMIWGTIRDGVRYLTEDECDLAFDLIDQYNLRTLTLG